MYLILFDFWEESNTNNISKNALILSCGLFWFCSLVEDISGIVLQCRVPSIWNKTALLSDYLQKSPNYIQKTPKYMENYIKFACCAACCRRTCCTSSYYNLLCHRISTIKLQQRFTIKSGAIQCNCICVYLCFSVCVCASRFLSVAWCIRACVSLWLCIWVDVCVCVSIYVFISLYLCICVYVSLSISVYLCVCMFFFLIFLWKTFSFRETINQQIEGRCAQISLFQLITQQTRIIKSESVELFQLRIYFSTFKYIFAF